MYGNYDDDDDDDDDGSEVGVEVVAQLYYLIYLQCTRDYFSYSIRGNSPRTRSEGTFLLLHSVSLLYCQFSMLLEIVIVFCCFRIFLPSRL